MTAPDYQGAGIANLMASIRGALGDGPGAAPVCRHLGEALLRDARHVVLLVIDGLGSAQLAAHAPHGVLASARVADLSSVFPSTTTSAVTTFLTGEPPLAHGLTGWHLFFRELGVVGAPLPFRLRGSDVSLAALGAGAERLFATRALSQRLHRRCVLVHPAKLCKTPYTQAHRGAAEVRPFRSLRGLFARLRALARERKPSYCYAYWPQLDTLSHHHGAGSAQAAAHLRALDAAVGACAARLRGTGTVLLVVADHGFVDTRAQTRLRLADHPRIADTLALPLCGEPRTAFCYVRPGAEAEFVARVGEELGHAVRVRSAAELLAEGILGPGEAHPETVSRLGTHVLHLEGEYCLTDRVPGERQPFAQVGVHGGLSDAELRVPLCVFRG